MFLVNLLRGNEIFMDRGTISAKANECKNLTSPPVPGTNLKYNTVTGNTAGSQVFIVYVNGRAYPDYLVQYYRGKRPFSYTMKTCDPAVLPVTVLYLRFVLGTGGVGQSDSCIRSPWHLRCPYP